MESDLEHGKIMDQAGKNIDQAYKIVRKTYQEINAMKDDFAEVLREIDPSIEFSEEYSYGPKSLYLKDWHVFLFRRAVGEEEGEKPTEEFLVALIIIFSPWAHIKKISSTNGPEIWICKIETKNIKEKATLWEVSLCLGIDERKNFDKKLEIGGTISNYHWKDDKGEEEWIGQFIGYPLTAIKDKAFIKKEIIDKLLIENYQKK
ncbi:MAG: hypothetical protein KKA79_00380 [Nanoarchaeota archaeon]|nr:hypothetical protein [Nanoarchaeota archaeon]MCG2717774.1 hypothetical protein [Nanoarchaeota archaeon]